jgi:acyl dehydratase
VQLRLERAPTLWHQYLRGAVLGPHRFPRGEPRPRIPEAEASLDRLSVDLEHLRAYRRLCALPESSVLPLTYPHVIATPVAAAMMVRSGFPYPLLGVVHVRQHIEQLRPIAPTTTLAVRTWFAGEREVARGVEFDTHTQIAGDGEVLWRGVCTALVRDRSRGSGRGAPDPRSQRRGLESDPIRIPADMGRRYARLTQDYNPIHLWPITARAFGFARPIVHGMWSLARGLAGLANPVPFDRVVLDCEFRKPVLLPCTVRLFRYEDETGAGFSLRDASGEKKHLECTLRPLPDAALR